MKEENQAIIKALNMYGRVPEQWELLNEIERLNNIINELEKWLKKEIFYLNGDYDYEGVVSGYENVLDKLQELKGSDKE